jgi:Tol biopolymer transport system component
VQRFIYVLFLLVFMTGCYPTTKAPPTTAFYVFRTEPPALIELSSDNRVVREIPVAIPGGCSLANLFAPPVGATLAIEYSCSFGQAVVYLNTDSGEATQPITDSDSHFLAWMPDGQSAYLKVDTVNRPRIVRTPLRGKARYTPLTEQTYDISPRAGSGTDLLFTFSRGMGQGSEMWYAWDGGRATQQLLADPHNYLSFARWSPDGSKIAFIKISDSATPFTVGELWVMNSDGSGARKLADADAGHGYPEAWSPDGSRIAFVVRDNPTDATADQNVDALKSNIAIVNIHDDTRSKLTQFQNARVQAPVWSPDGNQLAFTAVLNDKMNVYIADSTSGEFEQALPAPACCPVWIRK